MKKVFNKILFFANRCIFKNSMRYFFVEIIEFYLRKNYLSKTFLFLNKIFFLFLPINSFFIYEIYLRFCRALSLRQKSEIFEIEDKFLKYIRKGVNTEKINFIDIFLNTKKCKKIKTEFSNYGLLNQLEIKFPKINDTPERQGDLIILKPNMGEKEKGVLLVQYNDSFKRMAAIYDLIKLGFYYRLILEPSTWGYYLVEFLLFLNIKTEVIIEAQRFEDFCYIKKINNNFIPVRIGAGDWIDPEIFQPYTGSEKEYDLIMIASWLALKRHNLLFKSLAKIKKSIKRIALVGYSIGGRTIEHIKNDSRKYDVYNLIEFFENISQEKVNELLKKSKFSVMLSKREGASKVIYESFFTDVPVLISSSNVGVNREHINENTGIISSDEELHESIIFMMNNFKTFSPRKWAIEHTGCYNSNLKINDILKNISIKSGEKWTKNIYQRKINGMKKCFSKSEKVEYDNELKNLKKFLR